MREEEIRYIFITAPRRWNADSEADFKSHKFNNFEDL